jgi:hypothetical protein
MSTSSTALASSHLSGSTGELTGGSGGHLGHSPRRLSGLDGLGGSTGQLNHGFGGSRILLGHPQPYVAPTRQLDVVSSDDTQPSWSGITGQHGQSNSNGQASSSGVSSGPPGSNNVGSLGGGRVPPPPPLRRPQVGAQRQSLEARIDSGFSADPTRQNHMPDVRWSQDSSSDGQQAYIPEYNAGDELMLLLDLIHAKSERLKTDLDEPSPGSSSGRRGSTSQLHAISEDDNNRPPAGLESEVDQLRRERALLIQRVSELESGAVSGVSSSYSRHKEGNMSAGDSESSISGIVHSVHIRTGEIGGAQPIVTSSTNPRRTSRSVSHTDLTQDKPTRPESSAGVHIEIKNLSRSTDHLAGSSARLGSNKSSGSRRSVSGLLSSGQQTSVSVVNLKHGSVDNLPHQTSNDVSSKTPGRYLSSRQTFGQPTKSQLLRPNSLLPGRMVLGINNKPSRPPGPPPTTSGSVNKIKSYSVENLMEPVSTVLGLKAANSEMNMVNINNTTAGMGRRRLSGTTSELNVSRIGTSEKLKMFEAMEGVVSMPVELTKGLRYLVKPNRDKIRTILGMSNVIELQRQLLTTVMENEVTFLTNYLITWGEFLLEYLLN